MNNNTQRNHALYTQGVLRIISGLLFAQHGMQKFFLYPPGGHQHGSFQLFSLFGVAGVLELFGGFLLALGLFTRPVAFLLSGEMAVAYWAIHFPAGLSQAAGLFPVVNGGDLAILFCFTFLHLSVVGPGAWSIDSVRGGSAMPSPGEREDA